MSETSTTSDGAAQDNFDIADEGVASLFGGTTGTTTTTTEADTSAAATTDDDTSTSSTDDTTDTGVSTDEDETTTTTGDETDDKTPVSQFDNDLDDWAVSAGHDKPENDRERKLLQGLRNSSRDFTRSRQSGKTAKTLQSAIAETDPKAQSQATTTDTDDDDPLVPQVAKLTSDLKSERDTRLQSEFYQSANDGKGVTDTEGAAMVEVFKEKVDKGGQKAFDYWSDPANLDSLHDLAKLRVSAAEQTALSEKTRNEERQRLAKLNQANGPSQNAKTTKTTETKSVEQRRNDFWRSND